jgi:hypothetical protein
MASVERRIRRLEDRMDTSNPDAEARRRGKVRAELLEFEALAREGMMSEEQKEAWRQSITEELERRHGQRHWRGRGA